jgi:hypothetical protein
MWIASLARLQELLGLSQAGGEGVRRQVQLDRARGVLGQSSDALDAGYEGFHLFGPRIALSPNPPTVKAR